MACYIWVEWVGEYMKKKPNIFACTSIFVGVGILVGLFFSVKIILVIVSITLIVTGIGMLIESGCM